MNFVIPPGFYLGPVHTYPDIFLIRNFFFPDSKLSPSTRSVFKSIWPVHTHPMVSGFTLAPEAPLHWNVVRACAVERDSGGKFALFASTLCRHVALLFGERLDTLYKSSDSKICGFTCPHVIGFVADLLFSTLGSGIIFFRIRRQIRQMRVDGSRIWKEKVADSKISGYVWTGPKSHYFTSLFYNTFIK